jgi:hypothetical protein
MHFNVCKITMLFSYRSVQWMIAESNKEKEYLKFMFILQTNATFLV